MVDRRKQREKRAKKLIQWRAQFGHWNVFGPVILKKDSWGDFGQIRRWGRVNLNLKRVAVTTDPIPPKPTKTFDGPMSFGRALERRGYRSLGSGAYSQVYGKPGDRFVLKVMRRPSDDGWLNYIQWSAKKGYAGNFAPRVYSYKFIKGKEASFGVALMERLDKTVNTVGREHDATMLPTLFSYATGGNKMASLMLDNVKPGLSDFAKDLGATFKGGLDLHGGNFMLRADGSFCATDPVYYAGSNNNSRIRLRARDFTSLAQTAPEMALAA